MGLGVHVLDVDEREVQTTEDLHEHFLGGVSTSLDSGMHRELLALLKHCIQILMMQERLAAGKGDTTVGAPVVVVATQRVDKIGYRHNANGLLKSTGSARRGALDGLAVVADFPVYARLSVLVELN